MFENRIFINPRFPGTVPPLPSLSGHVWMATSGSKSLKWVALSKEALFSSAAAVNDWLYSDKTDIWLNPLPEFHVGGLGIKARAFLSGASEVVFEGKWDPQPFYSALHQSYATLTALVPTQLYDLVRENLAPPASLRAVIVGGGALYEPLYEQAVALGWKLLPSYGMTECASQVATAALADAGSVKMPPLRLLTHIQAVADTFLKIKSPALLTCYWEKNEIFDPKQEGWFETEDRAILSTNTLQILGRDSSFVKIGGESCSLTRLEAVLEELKLSLRINVDVALFAAPDPRLGSAIHLAATGHSVEPLVTAFQQRVLPFERIRKVHFMERIPRTALSKLIISELP